MSWVKNVFRIAAQNFRKWQTDYRIWTIAFFLITMTLIYTDDVKQVADFHGYDMPIWIFPFLYSQFYTKVVFTIPVILMFCDAPFVDKNQIFIMMRTSRTNWLCGQILYIVLASGIYYLFIFAISIILTVFYSGFSLDWGKTLTAIAYDSSVAFEAGVSSLSISPIVVEYFSPLLACYFTFIMSWLSAIFLGLLVFACNLLTGSRLWGIIAGSFFVAFTINAHWQSPILWLSPISWGTLDKINVGGLTVRPSFTYCICILALLILVLTTVVFLFGSKKSLDVKGDQ